MKIISLEGGRCTLLFPLEEIVPLGGADGRTIVSEVAAKYQFMRVPEMNKSREEFNRAGLVFENGIFEFESMRANINELSVFTDGIVVETNTTDRSEAFLRELLDWLRKGFGFREFQLKPAVRFLSQVVVEFDQSFSPILKAHERLFNAITDRFVPIYGKSKSATLVRIDLGIEPDAGGAQIPRFIIERRAGAPYNVERYFSGAPIQTKAHLDLLAEIERMSVS